MAFLQNCVIRDRWWSACTVFDGVGLCKSQGWACNEGQGIGKGSCSLAILMFVNEFYDCTLMTTDNNTDKRIRVR